MFAAAPAALACLQVGFLASFVFVYQIFAAVKQD
jgi:hypothetical protein